ncbi:hypothetical protein KC356_g4201 [Hortaea werneckii]|nr:hypothetical protein KC356_g4201 [Hortaea werneckii]
MDPRQAPLHVESILPAVANALLNLPTQKDSKDQSSSWFPCEIKVRRIGRDVMVRSEPTSHDRQGYEFVRSAPDSEVNWHDAFRVAPEDPCFVAILHVVYDGLLQLQSQRSFHSQNYRAQCDTDFHVTFGIWGSADVLHCDTIETDNFLSQDPVHSEVTYEQCVAFSQGILQASKAKASQDPEDQDFCRGKGQEHWPFRQCSSKPSSLNRSDIFDNDVCFEDSDATTRCCQDVEMQDVGDQTFVEKEREPFGAAEEEQQTPRKPSQALLPIACTKLETPGSAWEIIASQSCSHSPDHIQQELKRLLQRQPTVNKRDAGCLSMIYVIYLPELDRFKVSTVKQRRLKGRLESVETFREEGCMRRMAQMKKACGYSRIELGYLSEPLEIFLIRRLERFVHRALGTASDKIRCLGPEHNHVGFFDADFRVIKYIIENSLGLIREAICDGSECSSLSNSNLKANDFLHDLKPESRSGGTVSPGWEHPINVLNRFCTALRPESTQHPIYHPAQLSSEDQYLISRILDAHRHKQKETSVRSENLVNETEDEKTGEEISGLATLVHDAPALEDWKALSKLKSDEANDLTWQPLHSLFPGSLDNILDFIAGCLLQSRCHDKLARYLRLHQQLSQLR